MLFDLEACVKNNPPADPPQPTAASVPALSSTGSSPRPAEPTELPDAPESSFPIVGIGASAGGLAAFESFFAAMPPDHDTGMAFVLVQHLSPDHKSVLVDIVGRYARMPVEEAKDGLAVRRGCVYIIPPNRQLRLEAGKLWLSEHADDRKPRLTIDHFFQSLAQSQGEFAICIVMSGTGTDGTLGLREIKGVGGMAIVQSPGSSEYDGMPRSAIATGMADYVLAPAEMPAQLIAYARHAFDPTRIRSTSGLRNGVLKKLCLLLRGQTGHDFSQYKETTLVRRMGRRMALQQLDKPEDYLRYAREHPPELEGLFRDLLIGVTNFFRDPEAFKVLEDKVVPRLVEGKVAHEAVRVWVCACSTGEEAYSIAILLYEHMARLERPLKLQIFATDIDRQAVDQARGGVYPASISAHVSEERLARFFVHDAQRGTYRIQKHIRDLLVFSEQDVIKDPPFSRLDLVSCRNLLIYLNPDLQRKLIPLFHYALAPSGALFLGTSETLGESARLFSPVDRKWKLYFRLPGGHHDARPALPDFVPPLFESVSRSPQPSMEGSQDATNLRQVTEKALLAHYAQAAVLVNARGQMLHIVGRTGQFFEPADGDPAMNVLTMAREGLKRELTIALHKAVARKELVRYQGLNVKTNGDYSRVDLAVRPVDVSSGSVVYLVVLEQPPDRAYLGGRMPTDEEAGSRIAELERELRSKDEYLQTTLEEMETTNEELKSTNEEMQSINEELQSTNEELETSKEELQSVNEELSTVNAELQDRVADLSRANNDMNNLLAGTGVGTVFVDHHLRIARFTPAATQVMNLIPGDVGRPLAHVSLNFVGYDRMVEDITAVLDTLTPKEAEVQVKSGAWYLMRIRPYRTTENLIEGVVVTLVDISERKKAEKSMRHSEERLAIFIHQAYAGVAEIDLTGHFLFANDRLCEMLGYSREELLRRRVADLTDGDDLPLLRTMLEAFARGGPDTQITKRYVRKDGQRLQLLERVSALRDATGKPRSLLVLLLDDTED
ncbi:MAG TPA: chemotaxis protein CheB [Methylibium sp.]|uniref:chemotaxis protein CheB n=1 Tax=Methylibium sp. TaxID=2067992 RepID=UPI002DBF93ED|nr:chemotaxis protein CheB [Methylibium sp.]HEU4460037.1 chemotaxis protein CheB [Methylibium sp.]